ncbi:MAG: methyltransferase domain-containing protein [Pseudomonadota bacterium]
MSFSLPPLPQRERAAVDFMGMLGKASFPMRSAIDAHIEAKGVTAENLPDDLDERTDVMLGTLADSKEFRAQQLFGEWHARYMAALADRAFEAVKGEALDDIKRFHNGPSELHLDPDMEAPDYWDGVDFHRTAGGWDSHDYAGLVHGEIIHKRLVDKMYPGGIFKQRRFVADLAPKEHYDTILEMGTSTGHYTQALQQAYPKAQITGVELSASTLEHAARVANANGWAWKLYQRPAENTGFADASFDLVTSYILLHEIPADIIRAVFKEAFRTLKPGGDMVMSDVTRYADLDKLAEWRADFGALTGGEPWWRESASLDLGAVAEEAGFVDVKAWGEKPMNYPYVVMGRKPE